MSQPRVADASKKTNPRDTIRMNDDEKNQGEGNITADREYREGVAKTLANKDVEQLAEDAKDALEGPEGESLRKAERIAKQAGDAAPKNPAKSH